MFVDLVAVLEFLELVASLQEIFNVLKGILEAEDAPTVVPLTFEERVEALKKATLFVRRLQLDVNCYPFGAATVFVMDLDGNIIP